MQERLQQRLEALAAYVEAAGDIPVDAFLQTIAVITMIEKYYTPEQRAVAGPSTSTPRQLGEDGLRKRRGRLGRP